MKIMRSKIDKMIQEEIEDHVFSTEVESPDKATSIKIAKTRVKEIIQEELDRYAKLGHDEKFFSSPSRVEEDWSTSEFTDNEAENDGLKMWQNLKMSPLFAKQEPNFKEEFSDIEDALMGNKEKVGSAQAAFNTLVTHLGLEGTNVEKALRVVENEIENLSEGLLDRANAPAAIGEFGDLYDLWVGVGDDLRQAGAVDETFFEEGSDYNFVLNQLKNADEPNSPLWQEDDEDSGYSLDFGFPKLTNNQQDAIGIIGRMERDLGSKVPHGYKGFQQVAQWVKELEPPVDYTGMPEGLRAEAPQEEAPVWSDDAGFANKKASRKRDRGYDNDLDYRWNIFTQDYLYPASGFDDGLLQAAQGMGEYFREDLTRDMARKLRDVNERGSLPQLEDKYFKSPKIIKLIKEENPTALLLKKEFNWWKEKLRQIDMTPY